LLHRARSPNDCQSCRRLLRSVLIDLPQDPYAQSYIPGSDGQMTAQRLQPLFSDLPAAGRRPGSARLLANLFGLLTPSRLLAGGRRTRGFRAAICYLLLPRPGPLLSAGKLSFLLLGTCVAVSSGAAVTSPIRWFLVVVLYELFVSQAKYLLNDACGRMSDSYFLRGTRNRCPQNGVGLALLVGFATLRAGFGIGALLLCAGWTAAAAGALTLLLQMLYELVKLVRVSSRGVWLFGLVSANYGVRALAGMAAVSGAAMLSVAGVFVFLWAAALGALFLSIYWQRQGAFYLRRQQLSPALLARHKPGVLDCYRRAVRATRSGGMRLEHVILSLLGSSAVLFFLLGPWRGRPLLVVSMIAYACVGLAFLMAAHQHPMPRRQRPAPFAAVMVLAIAGAAAAGLYFRTPCLLPLMLLAIALFTYRIVSGPLAGRLLLDGSTDHASAPV
jgi:hypothetical protein